MLSESEAFLPSQCRYNSGAMVSLSKKIDRIALVHSMKVIPIRRICHFLGNHQRISVFHVLSGTHCIGVNVSETGGISPHEDLEPELCSTSNARAAKDILVSRCIFTGRQSQLQRSSNPSLPCDSLEIFDGSLRSPFLHLSDGRFRITRPFWGHRIVFEHLTCEDPEPKEPLWLPTLLGLRWTRMLPDDLTRAPAKSS